MLIQICVIKGMERPDSKFYYERMNHKIGKNVELIRLYLTGSCFIPMLSLFAYNFSKGLEIKDYRLPAPVW